MKNLIGKDFAFGLLDLHSRNQTLLDLSGESAPYMELFVFGFSNLLMGIRDLAVLNRKKAANAMGMPEISVYGNEVGKTN
jgi:hypothetical protein